eukprot:5453071-Pyramimonas_sp.AAC.1
MGHVVACIVGVAPLVDVLECRGQPPRASRTQFGGPHKGQSWGLLGLPGVSWWSLGASWGPPRRRCLQNLIGR